MIPISNKIACGIILANELFFEKIMNKFNNKENDWESSRNLNSCGNLYRKCLRDIMIYQKEYHSPCFILTMYVNEIKNDSLLEMSALSNMKILTYFFSDNKREANVRFANGGSLWATPGSLNVPKARGSSSHPRTKPRSEARTMQRTKIRFFFIFKYGFVFL